MPSQHYFRTVYAGKGTTCAEHKGTCIQQQPIRSSLIADGRAGYRQENSAQDLLRSGCAQFGCGSEGTG